MMNGRATVEPWLSARPDGAAVYGEAVELPCRLEAGEALRAYSTVTYGERQAVQPKARAFLPAGAQVPIGSRLTVDGETYRVADVRRADGFLPHHVEVALA